MSTLVLSTFVSIWHCGVDRLLMCPISDKRVPNLHEYPYRATIRYEDKPCTSYVFSLCVQFRLALLVITLFREKLKYIWIFHLLSTLILLVTEIFPHGRQEFVFPHSQSHGCWCPGDARSQGISSTGIDLSLLQYSSTFSTRSVNTLRPSDAYMRR